MQEAPKIETSLKAENDRLRKSIMALVRGLYIERCAGMGGAQCEKCSMYRSNLECAVTDAMELIGVDAIEDGLWKD